MEAGPEQDAEKRSQSGLSGIPGLEWFPRFRRSKALDRQPRLPAFDRLASFQRKYRLAAFGGKCQHAAFDPLATLKRQRL